MPRYEVGFDGRWQEAFDDLDQAVEWAEEVAATGRTVDVVRRRYILPPKFVTAFPESERAGREARWFVPWLGGGGGGGDGGGGGGGC